MWSWVKPVSTAASFEHQLNPSPLPDVSVSYWVFWPVQKRLVPPPPMHAQHPTADGGSKLKWFTIIWVIWCRWVSGFVSPWWWLYVETSFLGQLLDWVLGFCTVNGTIEMEQCVNMTCTMYLRLRQTFSSLPFLIFADRLWCIWQSLKEIAFQTALSAALSWSSLRGVGAYELSRNHIIHVRLHTITGGRKCFSPGTSSKGVTIDLVNRSASGYCRDVNKSLSLFSVWGRLRLV